jgi:hypothetical protein
MRVNVKRGFNRLFLVLTLMWATLWAVLYPLERQWEGQQKALEERDKENKNCDVLITEQPEWSMTKNCYARSEENFQNALRFSSFGNFWMYPMALWELFLPLIVLPPGVVYGLVFLGIWIRNGFKPRSSTAEDKT